MISVSDETQKIKTKIVVFHLWEKNDYPTISMYGKMLITQIHRTKIVFHKIFVIKSMAKPLLLYSRMWQKNANHNIS